MNLRHPAFVSVLVLGLSIGPATPTIVAQQSRVSGSVERPSINGDAAVILEVEDETVRIGAQANRRTRREFATDPDGRQRLVMTIEEELVATADGGQSIVRSYTEPDVNGRSVTTRRETEETVAAGDGFFTTQIEVSIPGVNPDGFISTQRVERRERRDGGHVLEIDQTTYTNPTGRGTWEVLERRIVNREYRDEGVRTVESIYTDDGGGDLVLSDQIVSKEWTEGGGREYRTEEIFARDIIGQERSPEPRLFQQVEIVRAPRSGGGWKATRVVKETRGNRLLVVEQVVETSRPDGRGGTVIERETQRLDVNGQLRTVDISRTRDSGPR